jgi:hypothetical protein
MSSHGFEDLFKDAFKGAEVAPSDSVWTNVELELEKESGGKMKRRLLFFQLLAAASMVFAMGVGSVYYLRVGNDFDGPLAQQYPASSSDKKSAGTSPTTSTRDSALQPDQVTGNTNSALSDAVTGSIEENNNSESVSPQQSNRQVKEQVGALDAQHKLSGSKETRPSIVSQSNNSTLILASSPHEERKRGEYIPGNRRLPALVEASNPKIEIPSSEPDPGMVLLARLQDEERKYQQDGRKTSKGERLWTSVGFAAGSFNPNAPSSQPAGLKTLSTAGTKPSTSSPTSGVSYSVGASVAGKVAKRVVLQGGISYLTQNAGFTSSTTAGKVASLNEFTANNDETIVTEPYKVNSNLQFLSVPVLAGFVLVDQKFAIQLNGGVATDFFLQNTLTPENDSYGKVTQGAGSDSPYRTVNFSGLVGTEFSYKVGEHYRIALNPGLRYSLNSIYKEEVAAQQTPFTFDVGLRFRYIFK